MKTQNSLTDSYLVCHTKSISLKYLNIKKIDTIVYEEGRIYNIFTSDNSVIIFLCGNNADIMNGDDYKVLDSAKTIYGNLSLRGIQEKSGLFWRKDGVIGYERVKKKDTSRYNKIFNNNKFIRIIRSNGNIQD